MPQKNIFSNYLYLLPCSSWMDICEREFREFNSHKKTIEKEFRYRNKEIKKEFNKVEDIKDKKLKLKESKTLKDKKIEEAYSSTLIREQDLRNQILINLGGINEENILQDDHILITKKNNAPSKNFNGIAFITDVDEGIIKQWLEETVFSVYAENYRRLGIIKKHDFIDSLNYKRLLLLPFNIVIGKKKKRLILFGDYVWTLNDNDKIMSDDQIMLLMLEQIDKERKKFERLKNKFFNPGKVDQEAQRARIPEDVRIFVWRRDQGKCVKCGSSENLEYDHIIPVSKGGSSTARNIQLLCEKCNRAKGANFF